MKEEQLLDNTPLSLGQQALWFLHNFSADHSAYNINLAWQMSGSLSIDRFVQCIQILTKRHVSLRSNFSLSPEGELVQQTNNKSSACVEIIDSMGSSDDEIKNRIVNESSDAFDLSKDVLWRWKIYKRSEQDIFLHCSFHHIAVDQWSITILFNELNLLYEALLKSPTNITPQQIDEITQETLEQVDTSAYHKFVYRQEKLMDSRKGEKLGKYWVEQLKDAIEPLNLPTDQPRSSISKYRGDRITTSIPDSTAASVKALAEEADVNIFTFYLAVFQTLIHRYTSQTSILTSSPTAGRRPSDKQAVGYFVNPIVIRGNLTSEKRFFDFLKELQKTTTTAIMHRDYPFIKIVENLQITRESNRAPITPISFAWNEPDTFGGNSLNINLDDSGIEHWQIANNCCQRLDIRAQEDDFDLFLTVSAIKDKIAVTLEYNNELYNKETADRLLGHYSQMLNSIIANPEQAISRLQYLTQTELETFDCWNAARSGLVKETLCAHEYLEEHAANKSNAVAVISGEDSLTFGEVNQKANQLAAYLRKNGSKEQSLIGICMNKSTDLIVAIYAVLKAGAAYVPIDPDYPRDRLTYIIEDARIQFVISQSTLKTLTEELPTNVIYVDDQSDEIAQLSTSNLGLGALNHLSYIIYTSGSTGKPKGVALEHRGLCSLFQFAKEIYSEEELSGVLAAASINFDLHVYEILVPTALGGCVILAENPLFLSSIPARNKVKMFTTVPSAMKALLQVEGIPSSVTTINLGGEPVNNNVVQSVYELNHIKRVLDLYGPSEDTFLSTFFETERNANYEPYIGKPINETQCYVIDENNQHVPIGVIGELAIGGKGLAREYINQTQRTIERFIPNPFKETHSDNISIPSSSDRIYKTGDLARFRNDGNIELLGRKDYQVKIRGFRIELGEIENALNKLSDVEEAVVQAQETKKAEKALVAYIALERNSSLIQDSAEHRQATLSKSLKSQLPEYMLPAYYIFLEEMPLNPNGKIDRHALLPFSHESFERRNTSRDKRRSDIADKLAKAWEEVLGTKDISIHANFFDIGGHSLLMAQVFSIIKDWLPKEIKLVDLYQYPTIHLLESRLKQLDKKIATGSPQPPEKRETKTNNIDNRIAIIGMACKYPGADNSNSFWENIKNGIDSICEHSIEDIINSGVDQTMPSIENYVKRTGTINDFEYFDADFFNVSPKEAQITDPQQRLFLECTWEALEDASIIPDSEANGLIGIFAGCGQNSYYQNHLAQNTNLLSTIGSYQLMLANEKDFLCSRVAYKLNTLGPTLNIQTACSTSLSATHVACESLKQGLCDIAIAGGASLSDLKKGYQYREGMILSPDGYCRTFDNKAQGTVPSQGVGIVILKRLKDAVRDKNNIYAIIAGSAINNDGAQKAGYTAPAIEGQARVIQSALSSANITPDKISYVEAHGTATPVGDPIEFRALNQVYGNTKLKTKGSCAIGSVKSNIGHTDTAAGVAGLIKTAKALKNLLLPPSLHFENANKDIDFDKSTIYVNTGLTPWLSNKDTPRYAGVSSFGLGGTNAHVILKEFIQPEKNTLTEADWHFIPLSAKTEKALEKAEDNLRKFLNDAPRTSIDDICRTLLFGRKHFPHKKYYIAKSTTQLAEQLENRDEYEHQSGKSGDLRNSPIVFMFPGGGAQYQGMAKSLYDGLARYRYHADLCINELAEKHPDLFSLYENDDLLGLKPNVNETLIFHPSLFIVEYALGNTLIELGIKPDFLIGHSLGEYAAACLANVISLSDALYLVIKRAQLASGLPSGAMLSVKLSENEITPLLTDELELSLVNSSHRCTVSGPKDAINELASYCEAHEIEARVLPMSQGFHSKALDPILEDFRAEVNKVTLYPPQIKLVSTVTGDYLKSVEVTNPEYWVNHLRKTNRFSDSIQTLFKDEPKLTLIDVGPSKVLSTLTRQHASKQTEHIVLAAMAHIQDIENDFYALYSLLGEFWVQGNIIEWGNLPLNEEARFISLPTYPFDKKRYWIETSVNPTREINPLPTTTSKKTNNAIDDAKISSEPQNLSSTEKNILEKWKIFLGNEAIKINDNFFEIGGDSLVAIRLIDAIREQFQCRLDSHALMKYPTIKKLARHIDKSNKGQPKTDTRSEHNKLLVELKLGQSNKNWFLIHPGGGHLFFYNDLVNHFDPDFNLFGIQARGCDGKSTPINNIKTMATAYIEEIRRKQPKGPYFIGGASFGGVVAFEIAQQLKAADEEVPLIYMVDSPGPGQMMKRFTTNTEIIRHFFTDLNLTYETLIAAEHDIEKQVAYIKEAAKQKGLLDMLPPNFNSAFINMVKAHLHAMYDYIPEKYDGNVLFFRHSEAMEDYSNYPELAWIPLVGGGCRVYPVNGNHLTMNFSPNVQAMANQISRTIKDLIG